MRPIIFRQIAYLPLLALALAPVASAASLKNSTIADCQVWNLDTEASDALTDVKSLSGKLAKDASTLESFKRQTTLGWQTHAYQLTQVREHINAIGKRLDRLQAIQSMTAPWQQRAIEEIVPVAADLAAHAESAIQHLNENHRSLHAPVYAGHLTSIADRSNELKSSVDAFLEYGDTAQKLETVQQKLDRLQMTIGLTES